MGTLLSLKTHPLPCLRAAATRRLEVADMLLLLLLLVLVLRLLLLRRLLRLLLRLLPRLLPRLLLRRRRLLLQLLLIAFLMWTKSPDAHWFSCKHPEKVSSVF